jgi:hypothetical protein
VSTKRNVYLDMRPLEEARQILFDHFPATGATAVEMVSPPDAVGRVLAEPVMAAVSSPNFHAAAMDGWRSMPWIPMEPVSPDPRSCQSAPSSIISIPVT